VGQTKRCVGVEVEKVVCVYVLRKSFAKYVVWVVSN
jgi:hypothetical protein